MCLNFHIMLLICVQYKFCPIILLLRLHSNNQSKIPTLEFNLRPNEISCHLNKTLKSPLFNSNGRI